ncbi:hypothetical protein ACTOV4_00420 [Brucella sp. C7-11G]
MTLIDRLSKLEGPRYMMDVAIALETDFWPKDRIQNIVYNDDGDPTVWFTDGPDMPLPPAYTASVDAAIALAERVLPGWVFDNVGQDYEGYPNGYKSFGWTVEMVNGKRVQGQALTFPLAICIALLRAKEASKP